MPYVQILENFCGRISNMKIKVTCLHTQLKSIIASSHQLCFSYTLADTDLNLILQPQKDCDPKSWNTL